MKWQVAIIIENARVYAFGFFQQRSIEHEPHHDCDARIKNEIDERPAIRFRTRSTDCLQCLVDILINLIADGSAFEQQPRQQQQHRGEADGVRGQSEEKREDKTGKGQRRCERGEGDSIPGEENRALGIFPDD